MEKYVSLGEHRSGTPADTATSFWLGEELSKIGYKVNFLNFPIKQFFLESASISSTDFKIKAFPLWWVNDSIPLEVSGQIKKVEKEKAVDLNGSIALIQIAGSGVQSANSLNILIDSISKKQVKGIIIVTESKSGEIVAINTTKEQKAWKVPVVLIASKDAKSLQTAISKRQIIQLSIKGKFKAIEARNVYATIGHGEKQIVISTPISGWFTNGGERGSGVAIWLALAKWAAVHHEGYTFYFTGNSGHELNSKGAQEFLEHAAPSPSTTQLWIHLGAGAATLQYKTDEKGKLIASENVDSLRNFYYDLPVSESFNLAFKNISGHKLEVSDKPGGELIHVVAKGYKRFVGISYSHPYFHTPADDASTTSPEILEKTALAFKKLLEIETKNK